MAAYPAIRYTPHLAVLTASLRGTAPIRAARRLRRSISNLEETCYGTSGQPFITKLKSRRAKARLLQCLNFFNFEKHDPIIIHDQKKAE